MGTTLQPALGTSSVTGPSLRLGARTYPVLLPKLTDPRLHLASVIFSLQILGQTVLGFDLSIAQILLCLGTCALLESGIAFVQRKVIMWPASALLTGNGVAFILRVPGTEHGDWWSLQGAPIFVSVAALALLSKYAIRSGDRHLFNPSNLALVVAFVILGSNLADPQDLWWGPLSGPIAVTLAVIVVGGLTICSRQGLLGAAVAFYTVFGAGTAVIAASGHCITARWSSVPICGESYWWVLMTSPEILVFCFFMITDPRTIPAGRVGRIIHGAAVAALSTLLVAPHTTEFATKVSILGALVAVCAFRPLIDRWAPDRDSATDRLRTWLASGRIGGGAIAAGAVVAVAAVLLGSGAREVPPLEGEQVVAVDGRPQVEVDGLPEVTIGPSAQRVQPPVAQETADRMGRDLAEGLAIVASAHRDGDADVMATAAAGKFLDSQSSPPAEPGAARAVDYVFESLSVELVRDPAAPQSAPRLGIRAIGTASSGDATPTAFDGTFVLVEAGEHFVITELVGAQP